LLDCNGGPPALAWRQSLIAEDGKPPTLEQAADLLFGLMTVGDDRAIDQTWAMGRQVYRWIAAMAFSNGFPAAHARCT
jgi:guanine deaminase